MNETASGISSTAPAAQIAKAPLEFFDGLARLAGVRHAFIGRVPGIPVDGERADVLARLDAAHRQAYQEAGFGGRRLITAAQVHGCEVAAAGPDTSPPVAGTDSLITDSPEICLGIYVADCCAVYVVDPVRRCIGLAHSGRKGTALGILTATISALERNYGSNPRDLTVQLSPCIRPPHYEEDFAAAIADQARARGVKALFDCGISTAAHPDRYYSYRMEKGRTGRMLALLALT